MQNRTGVIARNYSGPERVLSARESSMKSHFRVINAEIGSRRETNLAPRVTTFLALIEYSGPDALLRFITELKLAQNRSKILSSREFGLVFSRRENKSFGIWFDS